MDDTPERQQTQGMPFDPDAYSEPLDRAHQHARSWLATVPERHVAPALGADEMFAEFGGPLPVAPGDPGQILDFLAQRAEPGLAALGSGRFFGFVIGGVLPTALASDWLVSAWDQNTGLRFLTPATAAIEEVAGRWILDLLGLPATADVGFVTGGTMANFTCLAAARQSLYQRIGWDLDARGLAGAPPLALLVGRERHDTVDLALRYLGLGAPTSVEADEQGRIDPAALRATLTNLADLGTPPVLLSLQAGNLHSGAFDPFAETIAVARAYPGEMWVHIDGAFGLFAGAAPGLAHLTAGYEAADSWATDAHKTLNVPYDCGIAIVADPQALRSALGAHAVYLIHDEQGPGDPLERTPEFSRRARGVPVWAALRSLGRSGVEDLVQRFADSARALADGIGRIEGVTVLNDVVYTQVCLSFGSDDRTAAVAQWLLDEGTVWMTGSRWQGRGVLRISVSNWSTDESDVARSVDAVRRAVAAVAE